MQFGGRGTTMKTKAIDISALPAGREMDALMAKLIGWEFAPELSKEVGSDCWLEWNEAKTDYRARLDWTPSILIALAWEVVEKLLGDGYAFHFTGYFYKSKDMQDIQPFAAVFNKSGRGYSAESRDTAPLAICRAALKAKQGV